MSNNPLIKRLERGLLYKTIQIILQEENSETQEKTREICQALGINEYSYRDDDYKVIADVIDSIFLDRQALSKFEPIKNTVNKFGISNLSIKVNQALADEEERMRWIIFGACTLVGIYFIQLYLKKRKINQKVKEEKVSVTLPPIPAALCLVVPAKIASFPKTKTDLNLSIDDVAFLIDNAIYFLSTRKKEADLNDEKLELTNEPILPNSNQDVYVRIDLSKGGREMIDKKILYILKRNLPTDAQFTINKIACIRNLSGLELFNRI